MRLAILVVVFVAFSAYSVFCSVEQGYTGFLVVAGKEIWGLQMLLDIAIACSLFSIWMVKDAKQRSLPFVPYLLGIATVGSIGALAYLIHRELDARSKQH